MQPQRGAQTFSYDCIYMGRCQVNLRGYRLVKVICTCTVGKGKVLLLLLLTYVLTVYKNRLSIKVDFHTHLSSIT